MLIILYKLVKCFFSLWRLKLLLKWKLSILALFVAAIWHSMKVEIWLAWRSIYPPFPSYWVYTAEGQSLNNGVCRYIHKDHPATVYQYLTMILLYYLWKPPFPTCTLQVISRWNHCVRNWNISCVYQYDKEGRGKQQVYNIREVAIIQCSKSVDTKFTELHVLYM